MKSECGSSVPGRHLGEVGKLGKAFPSFARCETLFPRSGPQNTKDFAIFSQGARNKFSQGTRFLNLYTRFPNVEKTFSKINFRQVRVSKLRLLQVRTPWHLVSLRQAPEAHQTTFPRWSRYPVCTTVSQGVSSRCRAKFSQAPKSFPGHRFRPWNS